jgi:hypothetical protein
MGQFGNQPDFITNDIKTVTPVLAANLTAADSLDGSIIYVGTSAPGNIQVIPVGTVGPSVISGFSSPGYTGSGGTGYGDVVDENTDMIGGSGNGLDILYTAVNGQVVSITQIIDQGTGYLNGDLVTVDGGDANAVFRIVATPGLPTVTQAITFTNVIQGEWFPVVVDYVLSNATTVTNLVAGK